MTALEKSVTEQSNIFSHSKDKLEQLINVYHSVRCDSYDILKEYLGNFFRRIQSRNSIKIHKIH